MLIDKMQEGDDQVAIGTMRLAKGLEFKAVAVMACDEGLLPLESRIEQASDESELDEVYDTERHLLYVACTRARDQVMVTGVEPGLAQAVRALEANPRLLRAISPRPAPALSRPCALFGRL